jgi:hypothetical protein
MSIIVLFEQMKSGDFIEDGNASSPVDITTKESLSLISNRARNCLTNPPSCIS